jgi:flagellar biosynthetic protein FliR
LGLIVGLTAKMFFAAVQLAGQLIGFQMGFSIAGAFDPESGTQGSVLAEMGYWIAIVLFLLLNGHHIFLRSLTDSFTAVEVGSLRLGEGLFRTMLEASKQMFVMSLKVGAPAVVALLFTSASFGIVAKVVPQMNILIVAFPLKVVVGLFFFGFSVEMLLFLVRQYVANFEGMLGVIMKLMKV